MHFYQNRSPAKAGFLNVSIKMNAGIEREMTSLPANSCEKHAGLIPAMIQLEEELTNNAI